MAFKITTTGLQSTITFNDLGERTINHPIIDLDLEQEYNLTNIKYSDDLQNAIDSGWITAVDSDDNPIVNLSDIGISPAFIKKDEGSGVGFVINAQDRLGFNPIGGNTLDLQGDLLGLPKGISGPYCIVNGSNISGNSFASIISGLDLIINGQYGLFSGLSNTNNGLANIMTGTGLDSGSVNRCIISGRSNVLPTVDDWGLIIGNGTVTYTGTPRLYDRTNTSDAIRIRRSSGLIELPSITDSDIENNNVNDKVAITKEWYVNRNFYQFFQGTGTEYVGQTTIPLMNQQANVFETYIEKSFLIKNTDNYKIDLSFISSLNVVYDDFIALLDINDGTTTETLTIQTEPKDSVGTGILVDVIQGGVIQPQIITSTNQRNATTFTFNRQLVAGLTYTFTLRFGCDRANRRATIYQAQVMIEQKTLIL